MSALGPRRWRAFGVAFLLSGCVAAVAGIIEVRAANPTVTPATGDLPYGACVHALMALILTSALRLVFWRAADRLFPWIALGGLLVVELAVIVPYWLNVQAHLRPFETAAGKLATLAVMGLGALVGVAAAAGAYRIYTSRRGTVLAHALPAALGIVLALALLGVAGFFLLREMPRPERTPPRTEALRPERPDVFVILIDTLRRDHLSFYGYPRRTSPNLDRLLAESCAFASAYTPSTWTIPSVASLFTGLYPTSHGVYGGRWALPAGIPTLASQFRGYGYRTAAFVGNKVISRLNGYHQGFEVFIGHSLWWGWNDRTFLEGIAKRLTRPNIRGVKGFGPLINDRFLSWCDEHAGEPRFAYLHYMDPHHPYQPPRSFRDAVAPGVPPGPQITPSFRDHQEGPACADWGCVADPPTLEPSALEGMIANYDGEIRHVDFLIGQLLNGMAERGLLQNAHLLLLSDHGEEFFDHRGWRHGHSIYEEVTGCVMAYRPPGGLVPGRVIERPVAMLDLVRTLCDLLGFELTAQHQGRPIGEITEGVAVPGDAPVLCEAPPHLYTLRLRNWKVVRRGPDQRPVWSLYDIDGDPRETRDLTAAYPDTLAGLRSYLESLVGSLAQTAVAAEAVTADPRSLEQLRALGYLK